MADKKLEDLIVAALISHTHDDLVGKIDVNVTDGLFAIAHAINRLAAIEETRLTNQTTMMGLAIERSRDITRMMKARSEKDDDKPGHA